MAPIWLPRRLGSFRLFRKDFQAPTRSASGPVAARTMAPTWHDRILQLEQGCLAFWVWRFNSREVWIWVAWATQRTGSSIAREAVGRRHFTSTVVDCEQSSCLYQFFNQSRVDINIFTSLRYSASINFSSQPSNRKLFLLQHQRLPQQMDFRRTNIGCQASASCGGIWPASSP